MLHRLSKLRNSRFAKDSVFVFAVKGLSAVALFVMNVLIARKYGAEGAGYFFLAWTLTNIAVSVGRLGLENTVTRYVAVANDKQDWPAMKGVQRHALHLTVLACGLITVALFLLSGHLALQVFSMPGLEPVLAGMSLAVMPMAVYYLSGHLLKGVHKPAQGLAVMSLLAPASMVLILSFLESGSSVIHAVIAVVASSCLVALVAWSVWRQSTPELSGVAGDFSRAVLLKTSMPMLVGSMMSLVVLWSPMLILGAYASSAEVAIFNAANRVSILISFALVAVNTVAGARFAVMYGRGNIAGMQALARKMTLSLLVLAVLFFFVLLVYGSLVMSVFGTEFAVGAVPLIIMAAGQLVNVSTGPVGVVLSMSGNEAVLRNILMFCALVAVVMSAILIPHWHSLGAAIVVALTVGMQNILATYFVRKKLGIRILF